MFHISLNRVRDHIEVREGTDRLSLDVDSDPRILISKIRTAQELLISANKNESMKDREQAAKSFSEALFGKEQAEKLAAFYDGDFSCVMTICGLYFERRLRKKIIKAQKKTK